MNRNQAEHLAQQINAWPFPYVNARVSTLGGEDRSSVMVAVSLDPREAWTYGYLENSRYAKLAFHSGREPDAVAFEHLSGHGIPKIRAWKTKDAPALYKKLKTVEDALRKHA